MNIETQNQAYVELSRDEVARRAVQLWKAAGRPAGRDLGYWLQAEVEPLSERGNRRPEVGISSVSRDAGSRLVVLRSIAPAALKSRKTNSRLTEKARGAALAGSKVGLGLKWIRAGASSHA